MKTLTGGNSKRCLLFTYGLLQPHLQPPQSATKALPAKMRGRLFDLGNYPGAILVNQVPDTFSGFVLDISKDELTKDVDTFERVAEGLFQRIIAETTQSEIVWIYTYQPELPPNAIGHLDKWPLAR